MSDGNVSAQNNVTTAAEYQAAADEITAIINAQRAERAPLEAEQVLLQNRAELLFERQQQALNTLRAAEADPSDTAFLEQSRLAYNRATGEVNTVNTAIQQNRSVLAQSRQSTAILQDQRSTLEVLAEFAEQGPPNQNSLPPPATTTPGQAATFVPTPPAPIPPTVAPTSQPAAAVPTATVSAQNNATTAAEYQQAADEITAIINAQRAERAPIEAEQELLRNRQEILIARQQTALNTLQAAEADPGDTAFLEASRTAYARATSEVNATNQAIQQNRSVLAQSRLSTAELQEQRGRLEVNADLAAQGAPTLNSLPPPATVIPDQAATYVAPPPALPPPEFSPPLLSDAELAAIYPDTDPQEVGALKGTTIITEEARRIMSDPANIQRELALQASAVSPVPPVTAARELTEEETGRLLDEAENPPAQNNIKVAEEWEETTFEISSAQRTIRAENFAAAENVTNLNQQLAQASQARQLARDNLDRAVAAGASDAEIAALDAQRQTALDTAVQLEQQIEREQSVIATNQETLNLLEQQRFIADEAALAARSGPPGLNSVPPPATVIPDQDPAAYDLPPQTYADNFQANDFASDGDEAISAYEQAQLAQQEGRAFAQPEIPAAGDEALQAFEEAQLAQQEGRAFEQVPNVPTSGDEALQAFEEAQLAQQEGRAFASQPPELNDPYYGLTPQQLEALGGADPTDPYIRARLGIPQLPGSELAATPGFGTVNTGIPLVDNALNFIGGLFGRPAAPPTPAPAEVTAASDAELQAIQDAEAQQLAEQEGLAFPPVEAAAPVTGDEAITAAEDAQAAELAAAEGSAFAEPPPVSTLDDPEARAIQDAVDADLAAQEGSAFPPVESPAPVGDEALQAIEDAEAAELAAAEGSAFAEPPPVNPELDEQLAQSTQGIEDAAAAELAAQEGSAFAPPVDAGSDAELKAIEDAQAADLAAQEGQAFPPIDSPAPVSGDEALQAIEDNQAADLAAQEGGAFATSATPVPVEGDEALAATERAQAEARSRDVVNPDAEDLANEAQARDTKAKLALAQQQATIQQRFNQTTKGDWRVRLRIAPEATYLYQDPANSILAPLRVSDGVVFPYTPTINTNYQAKYDAYDLTHSNYRGYFYKNSSVSDIAISATFTAQDTQEAQYVLAVIHFFRSVTKMFYGKDQQRGTPPPLVYLRGYGEYQFNDHPCLVSSFQYNLPNEVDYISVTPNNQGLNLSNRQAAVSSSPVSTLTGAINRLGKLFNAATGNPGVPKGATPARQDLGAVNPLSVVGGTQQTTYIPTKLDIQLTLLPVQTRSQVSREFSLQGFANGDLLRKGYW